MQKAPQKGVPIFSGWGHDWNIPIHIWLFHGRNHRLSGPYLKVRFSGEQPRYLVLRKCLPLLSLVIALFINGRYTIYEGEAEVGRALEKWVKPIETFLLHGDRYRLSVHRGNRFSLTKNGGQIALYQKRPEKTLEASPGAYDIDYDVNEPLELIELFCLLIDVFFFTPYTGASHINVLVPHDPCPERAHWRPKE